ncbi:MAG: hypothetical protein JOZ57_08820 [Abitibacteriaceae bacterium]|nr:hypothetical protein [Abditibacteriaceae bacterium]
MSQLIIVVISIALVAVAALSAAYYGGGAFMNGQAKAHANEVANAFDQENAALQLYNADNGIIYSPPTYGDSLSFLVPVYLSNLPKPFQGISFYNAGGNITSILVARLGTNEAVCKQIEALRTGTVPVSLRPYSSSFSNVIVGKIGCFYDDLGAWGSDHVAYYTPYGWP